MSEGALIPLVWNTLRWDVPTVCCTHGKDLNRQTDPWGEVSPLWHPAPPFCSLSSLLQSAGISLQPVMDIPSMLLHILIKELSHVKNGWGRCASVPVAVSLPSVKGPTSGHYSTSSSSTLSSHCSSHFLVLHLGSISCKGEDDVSRHEGNAMTCQAPPNFILSE